VSQDGETSVKLLRKLSVLGDKVPPVCSVKQLRQPGTKILGKCFSSADLLRAVRPRWTSGVALYFPLVLFAAELTGLGIKIVSLGVRLGGLGHLFYLDGWCRFSSGYQR